MKRIIRAEILLFAAFFAFSCQAARSPFQVDRMRESAPVQIPQQDVHVQGNFQELQPLDRNQKDPRWQYIDPLSVYMRTVWPDNIRTIRAAVNYLLEPTGYRLVTSHPAPREASLLVDKPLPPIARMQRTMPVVDALQLLVGLDNYVVIDRAHRLVSFQKNGGGV